MSRADDDTAAGRAGAGNARAGGCPRCGSDRVRRVVYGYPGPELVRDARDGHVILGGCDMTEEHLTRGCLTCDHRWSPRPPETESLEAED